jgi:hypothetical protein
LIGIAPDLIGVKTFRKNIPFVILTNSGWKQYKNAPLVEIKTFKDDQFMLSLRNQNYDGQYLILVNMKLDSDYLLPFFRRNIFNNKNDRKIRMDDKVFLEPGTNGVSITDKIKGKKKIGEIEIIKITSANDFIKKSDFCGSWISPYYVRNIKPSKISIRNSLDLNLSDFCSEENGLYKFNKSWYKNFEFKLKDQVTLSWKIDNFRSIKILKKLLSTLHIVSDERNSINNYIIESGVIYIIEFGFIDRRSNNNGEYFINKSLLNNFVDKEKELLVRMEEHIKNETN